MVYAGYAATVNLLHEYAETISHQWVLVAYIFISFIFFVIFLDDLIFIVRIKLIDAAFR